MRSIGPLGRATEFQTNTLTNNPFFSSVQLENDAHFVSSFDMTSLMLYVVFLLSFSFYHVYITNLPQTTKKPLLLQRATRLFDKTFKFHENNLFFTSLEPSYILRFRIFWIYIFVPGS